MSIATTMTPRAHAQMMLDQILQNGKIQPASLPDHVLTILKPKVYADYRAFIRMAGVLLVDPKYKKLIGVKVFPAEGTRGKPAKWYADSGVSHRKSYVPVPDWNEVVQKYLDHTKSMGNKTPGLSDDYADMAKLGRKHLELFIRIMDGEQETTKAVIESQNQEIKALREANREDMRTIAMETFQQLSGSSQQQQSAAA